MTIDIEPFDAALGAEVHGVDLSKPVDDEIGSAELKRMIRACEGGKIGSCSVLAALGQHENCLHEQHDGAEVLAGLPSKGA